MTRDFQASSREAVGPKIRRRLTPTAHSGCSFLFGHAPANGHRFLRPSGFAHARHRSCSTSFGTGRAACSILLFVYSFGTEQHPAAVRRLSRRKGHGTVSVRNEQECGFSLLGRLSPEPAAFRILRRLTPELPAPGFLCKLPPGSDAPQ